jgi:hypothetical protein
MKEEAVKKYVRDLDGMLREIEEWDDPEVYKMTHDMVIFLFGRIFRFLNFETILIGHDVRGDLDAVA